MNAQNQDNGFVTKCKVTVTEKGYEIHGSTQPRLKLRVQLFEFDSCIDGCELPVDALAGFVASVLPSSNFIPVRLQNSKQRE